MNKKDVEDLIFKLNEAEHAYYVKNTPIMSDGEYDKIFNQLKEIESKKIGLKNTSETYKTSNRDFKSDWEAECRPPLSHSDRTPLRGDEKKSPCLKKVLNFLFG